MRSPSSIVLPDCRALIPEPGLSPRQRRELVRVLAEQGPAGLAAWLRAEEQNDPRIRERVERERARLERQADAERRRLEASHDAATQQGVQAWLERQREISQREAELRRRLDETAQREATAEDLLRESPLLRAVAAPDDKVTGPLRRLWQRLRAWLMHRLSRGRPGSSRSGRRTSSVGVAPDRLDANALSRTRLNLDIAGANAGAGPGAPERVRSWWQRLLRRGRVREIQHTLEAEVEAAREAHRLRVEADANALRQRLASLEKEKTHGAAERDAQIEEERQRQADARRRFEQEQAAGPYEEIGRKLLADMEDAGLADHAGRATSALLERFAAQLVEETRGNLPAGGRTTPGAYTGGDGDYERGPLVSQHEVGAVELVDSLVRARIRHPHQRRLYDDDLVVHREIRSSTTHVIVVFDTSGSMETGGRLDAAKRVCLMLHRTVAEHSPDGRVDLLRMGTSVEPVDLAECWNAEPRGFTNFGAAFREAHERFERSGADRRLLYLITDGLPEAWTMPDGRDVADNPEPCMKYARQQARRLARLDGLTVMIYQLETRDEMFVEACRELAEELEARVETVEPGKLAGEAVGDLAAELAQPRAG